MSTLLRFPAVWSGIIVWACLLFAQQSSARPAHVRELVTERSANTRVYQVVHPPAEGLANVADCSRASYIFEKGTGINHRTPNGTWEKTDTTFTPASDDGFLVEAFRQRAPVRLRRFGGFNVEYRVGGIRILLGLESVGYFYRSTKQYSPVHRVREVPALATGDCVTFRDAFPGADVQYRNRPAAFKQDVVIKDVTAFLPLPPRSSPDAVFVVATRISIEDSSGPLPFVCAGLESVIVGGAPQFTFVDRDGWPVSFLARANAYDSTEPVSQTLSVEKHVVREAGGYLLLEGIPLNRLQKMQLPLVLDYILRPCTTLQSTPKDVNAKEVWSNRHTYWVSAPLQVTSGDELCIEPGTVVKLGAPNNNDDECIEALPVSDQTFGLNLYVTGLRQLPIVFTSYADDGYGEDIDTGEGGMPPETSPARGDYAAAIKITCFTHGIFSSPHSAPVRDCRVRYAANAIVDNFHVQVSNNVVRDCSVAIWAEKIDTPPFSENGSSSVYLNNLIVDCPVGVVHAKTEHYLLMYMINNTIDGAVFGFLGWNDGIQGGILFARNNLLTNCTVCGFYDYPWVHNIYDNLPLFTVEEEEGGGNEVEFNSFYAVGSGAGDAYWGEKRPQMNPVDLALFDQYLANNPYDLNNTDNGAHYLSPTYGPLDNIDVQEFPFPYAEFLALNTTLAPVPKATGAISSNQTWSTTVSLDSDGYVDGGYHHAPVDYVVGTGATSQNYRVYLDADVTIDDGVIVAFYRPADACVKPEIYVRDGSLNATSAEPDPIVFDSSYYLGTHFFDSTDGSAPGEREGGGIYVEAGGGTTLVEYCHFRHMDQAIYIDGWDEFTLKNNIFEDCYNGVYAVGNDELTIVNNAILGGHGKALALYDSVVSMFCNTIRNYTVGVDIKDYAEVTAFLNIVEGCKQAGFQCVEEGEFSPGYLILNPLASGGDSNVYFNNGTADNRDVVSQSGGWVSGYPAGPANPWLVAKSPLSGNPYYMPWHYADHVALAQNAPIEVATYQSRIPFRFSHLSTTASVAISAVENWPTGTWEVWIASLDNPGDASTRSVKAYAKLINGNFNTRTVYPNETAEGDLLVLIKRYDNETVTFGDGPTFLTIGLRNGSNLKMRMSKAEFLAAAQGEGFGRWVSSDGSTWHANETGPQPPGSEWDSVVDNNARYAIWTNNHDTLINPFIASVGDGAAVFRESTGRIHGHAGYYSLGTTMPKFNYDASGEPTMTPDALEYDFQFPDYFPLDAGYHRGGKILTDFIAPSGVSLWPGTDMEVEFSEVPEQGYTLSGNSIGDTGGSGMHAYGIAFFCWSDDGEVSSEEVVSCGEISGGAVQAVWHPLEEEVGTGRSGRIYLVVRDNAGNYGIHPSDGTLTINNSAK